MLTWNIHGALGRNPRFDLKRVVELIDRWDPQIVALQEVDSRREKTDDNPFELLQRELGAHGIGAKSITTADGDYGQMLISRWPLSDTVIHDISYPEREPRRAIASTIATPHGPLRFVATHLGLSTHERRDHDCRRRFQRLVLGRLGAQRALARAAGVHPVSHFSVAAANAAA